MSMPATMRVARVHAWGNVRVDTAEVPRPRAGEVVVRIDACGLCGSDALAWYVTQKAPVVLGHEPVGRIAAVGEDVHGFRPGDRVFVHHHAPCMSCEECERRLWSSCATWRATRLDPGGFAEYARVPAPNVAHDVLPLPASLSDDAATFIEPVACCLRAVRKARPSARDRVLVLGLGAMGLIIGQLARLHGVAGVIGADPRADRREARFACEIFDDVAADAGAARQAAHARGADVVIVTPGSQAAVEAGIAAAAPGARVVCFTPLDPAVPLTLDPARLYFREIELLQSYSCGPDETRESLGLLQAGTVRWEPLVTARVGLDGVADALRRAHDAVGYKTIVYPGGVPAASS